jgi:hypothetical protein
LILSISENGRRDFSTSLLSCISRGIDFIWSLVVVYGAAQEEYKAPFLRELVNMVKDNPCPILTCGDFDLLRIPRDKSKGRIDNH